MNVYIIEFRRDIKSFISNAIHFFDKSDYTHSGIFIDRYFCELDATDDYKDEPDYHITSYGDVANFLNTNPNRDRTEAYGVPHDFSDSQIGIDWWLGKESRNIKYGYDKLLRFIYLSNSTFFLKAYYKAKGHPYHPIGDSDNDNVCSEAVGLCLKRMGWWISDYDKRYDYLLPETVYPGLYAECLKDFRYTS